MYNLVYGWPIFGWSTVFQDCISLKALTKRGRARCLQYQCLPMHKFKFPGRRHLAISRHNYLRWRRPENLKTKIRDSEIRFLHYRHSSGKKLKLALLQILYPAI